MLAFAWAPRINAAGRMDVARDVIELFTCKDQARCKDIAEKTESTQPRAPSRKSSALWLRLKAQLAADPDLTGKVLYGV